MGDIPSKEDFVDAADDYRQLANHMRRKGCPTAAEENDLIALACTIAGNVVDAERFYDLLADYELDIDALIKALSRPTDTGEK